MLKESVYDLQFSALLNRAISGKLMWRVTHQAKADDSRIILDLRLSRLAVEDIPSLSVGSIVTE